MDTTVPNAPVDRGHEAGDYDRRTCIDLERQYFANCPVGPSEDCTRENATVPFGLVEYRPSCSVFLTCRSIQ